METRVQGYGRPDVIEEPKRLRLALLPVLSGSGSVQFCSAVVQDRLDEYSSVFLSKGRGRQVAPDQTCDSRTSVDRCHYQPASGKSCHVRPSPSLPIPLLQWQD